MLWGLLEQFPRALSLFLWAQTDQPGVKFYTLKDPEPEPSLAWFILNAFFFIGVVLAIVVGLGVAVGSFRLWLLEKFPNNRFNGAEEDDIGRTFRLNDHQ